jgi:transposase
VETVVERPAALDVHKAQVTACVRVPGVGGRREQHIAEFASTVRGLLALRDWLASHGATQVVMEATGVYWKAPWAILEDEFDCLLVNARHVKQVPGRKTDVSDAAWLCQLAEAGLLKANFVPPKPIRQLRNLTRYRKTQIQERAREVNRPRKALEDAGIKLDTVASDVMGKSGRDMHRRAGRRRDRPGRARRSRAPADAQEDPRPAGGARRTLRRPSPAVDRRDPAPHRFPGRADRAAHRHDRRADPPFRPRG